MGQIEIFHCYEFPGPPWSHPSTNKFLSVSVREKAKKCQSQKILGLIQLLLFNCKLDPPKSIFWPTFNFGLYWTLKFSESIFIHIIFMWSNFFYIINLSRDPLRDWTISSSFFFFPIFDKKKHSVFRVNKINTHKFPNN